MSLREHSAMTLLDFLYCNGAVEVDECGLSSDTFSVGVSVVHEMFTGLTYVIAEKQRIADDWIRPGRWPRH